MGNEIAKQVKSDVKKNGKISFCAMGFESTSFPRFIKYKLDFSLVTIFEAEDNLLTSIPSGIDGLVNLKILNLRKNNIFKFVMPALAELKQFDIGFNPLTELPDDLDASPNLEHISCYKCSLTCLPIECLRRMPKLSVIVNGNHLSIGYDDIPREITEYQLQGINDQHIPSEIIKDFLYLGSIQSAQNWAGLERFQIRHVVCMASMQLPFPDKIAYKVIKIDDIDIADIQQYFAMINQFVTTVKNAGGRVLIHCAAGVSRSATAVIAYLMASEGLSYEDARAFVMHRRPCICPNDGFVRQLQEYENYCKNTARELLVGV